MPEEEPFEVAVLVTCSGLRELEEQAEGMEVLTGVVEVGGEECVREGLVRDVGDPVGPIADDLHTRGGAIAAAIGGPAEKDPEVSSLSRGDDVSGRAGLAYKFMGFSLRQEANGLTTENPLVIQGNDQQGTFRGYWNTYKAK